MWVWYPTAPAPDAERAAYLPELWAPSGQFLGLDTTGLRSNAVADAAVATDQSTYPVLVLSPSGFPLCCWQPSAKGSPAMATSWWA